MQRQGRQPSLNISIARFHNLLAYILPINRSSVKKRNWIIVEATHFLEPLSFQKTSPFDRLEDFLNYNKYLSIKVIFSKLF